MNTRKGPLLWTQIQGLKQTLMAKVTEGGFLPKKVLPLSEVASELEIPTVTSYVRPCYHGHQNISSRTHQLQKLCLGRYEGVANVLEWHHLPHSRKTKGTAPFPTHPQTPSYTA